MIGPEQMRREAEARNAARMRALRNVRKRTLFAAFMIGESVWDIARRYGIEMSDVENALRVIHVADAGETR